jgi:superfamily I DNA/RNA helicase
VNYRTSHQIRSQADRLLGPTVSDVDGNTEERKGTTSVFNGPPPTIQAFETPEAERTGVGAWLKELVEKKAIVPHEVGLFVRSAAEVDRAKSAATRAGVQFKILDDSVEITPGSACIGTMHLAKGLEFRAVAVMACDDEVIPSQERIESAADDSDLEEIYNTERHLLYVACTRARDFLMVSGAAPVSEFLEDMAGKRIESAKAG